MVHQIVSQFYEIPVAVVTLIILAAILLWGVVGGIFFDRSWWRVTNIFLLVLSVLLIVLITSVLRNNEKSGIYLIPFSILEQARIYPDVYNQMVLNVLLFLPLGLSLPFCFSNRNKHPVLVTIIFAFGLSIIVEVLQYIFKCGYSELDDIMLNTVGAACGTIAYFLTRFVINMRQKGRNKVG
ncbi:MAG: VanZ family protein [Ruminococcus sp.]|nr:VanZ family protein [Ruminococcus sp.]